MCASESIPYPDDLLNGRSREDHSRSRSLEEQVTSTNENNTCFCSLVYKICRMWHDYIYTYLHVFFRCSWYINWRNLLVSRFEIQFGIYISSVVSLLSKLSWYINWDLPVDSYWCLVGNEGTIHNNYQSSSHSPILIHSLQCEAPQL